MATACRGCSPTRQAATAALAALSAIMEAGLAPKPPWTIDKVAESARRALVRGIVAFEIELTPAGGQAEAQPEPHRRRIAPA